MNLTVLPCPFCGSEARFNWDDEVEVEDEGIGRVRCTNSACNACSIATDEESAVEWWNRRERPAASRTTDNVTEVYVFASNGFVNTAIKGEANTTATRKTADIELKIGERLVVERGDEFLRLEVIPAQR